jgi:DNA repair exonuclease SbcCD ATPase subunit
MILLKGTNGNGKSAISDAIDFSLFGKVKGKDGNTAKINSIINWYNSNLSTQIEFNYANVEYHIDRGLSPSKFEIELNNKTLDRSGKTNKQEWLENQIEFDFKTWRSFVNITVSDFKNFMNLKAAEKRDLIDKLFNLGQINELLSITKDLKKNLDIELKQLEKALETNEYSINKLEKNINDTQLKINEANNVNKTLLENSIIEYKKELASLKEKHTNISKDLEPLQSKLFELENIQNSSSTEIISIKKDIQDIDKKINLYKQGKCPTCGSSFDSEEHISHYNNLKKDLAKFNDKIKGIEDHLNEIKTDKRATESDILIIQKNINEISLKAKELQTLGKKANEELEKSNNTLPTLSDFVSSLNELQEKQIELDAKLTDVKRNLQSYDIVIKLLGEKGVKQEFIQNLIPTVNHWVDFYLTKMESEFQIEFDENFESKVFYLNQEIDLDCLSRGQAKKANISVLLACLKIIRLQKYVNILFLDEVFEGIDVDNIKLMLNIFKEFSSEHKINVIIVHHADLDRHFFDKIYRIDRDIFSNINREK